ncbi:MAG: alpha/beta fold hydrolase [Acidobacteriota bacterium]
MPTGGGPQPPTSSSGAHGRKLRARWLLIPSVAFAALFGGALWYGSVLTAPVRRVPGPLPPGLEGREVEFLSDSGSWIRGWYIPGCQGRGGVVLMHDVRSDRRSMLRRARFLNGYGYHVLLFDFQAHGSSGGETITFGSLEAHDARAAVEFLRAEIPTEPIAAIGVSLGGAASVLGPEPLPVEALVLEAVYSDIREAIKARLGIRFGPLAAGLTPLFTLQLKPRLGVGVDDLRPLEGIARIRCPVLVIGGTHDRRTPPEQTRQLFAAAPSPKDLWIVPGASHADFHRFAEPEYEAQILNFLNTHLATPRASSGALPPGDTDLR